MTLFGIEQDGKLALTDEQIKADISGLAVYLQGYKFVLAVEPEGDPERFFFPDELSGEAVAVSAYVDGRALMALVTCAQIALTRVGELSGPDFDELRAAVAGVKAAMGDVAVEVRGGGGGSGVGR